MANEYKLGRKVRAFLGIESRVKDNELVDTIDFVQDMHWRHQLHKQTVSHIEGICHKVMKKSGYLSLSVNVGDMTLPITGEVEESLPYYIGLG